MKIKAEKIVTVSELENILKNFTVIEGMAVIAHIDQMTMPRVLKKDRDTKEPFTDKVEKFSSYSILLNTKYEQAIANRKAKEDAKGLETGAYDKGINTMPLDFSQSKNIFLGYYDKKGVGQLPVIVTRPNTAKTAPKTVTKYFLNGKIVDKNSLPNVLPVPSKPTNQGVNEKIVWRNVYLGNILALSLDGTKYVVQK